MPTRRPARRPADADRPMRAALYYRRSSEMQADNLSLDAQRRACRAYAEARGWTVAAEYTDDARSGRTADLTRRPAFSAMLDAADAGAVDVVVCHKLDRFARNVRVALEAWDRLERAGVAFVSVSEQIDFTTATGKLFRTMLAALGAWYSDNLAAEIRKGKAERKAQGLYNGPLPYGALKGDDGIPQPDPATLPGLLFMFTLAAEGQPDRDIARAMNAAGWRTSAARGNPRAWTKDVIRQTLPNRFYVGELPDGAGGWLPGKHVPIIDPAIFAAAEQARAANRTSARARMLNVGARPTPLSGLGHCGHCGAPMRSNRDRQGRARLRCGGRVEGNGCPAREAFQASALDTLSTFIDAFALPDDALAQARAMLREGQPSERDADRRRRDIAGRLERLKEMYGWGDLSRADYQKQRDQLEAERATLAPAEERATGLAEAERFLRHVPEAWAVADEAERNELARALFRAVRVTDGALVAVLPQPDLLPFFRIGAERHTDVRLRARKASASRAVS